MKSCKKRLKGYQSRLKVVKEADVRENVDCVMMKQKRAV